MTVSEVIEHLGGGTVVAAILSEQAGRELDREAVYKWAARGAVPWPWRDEFIALAKRNGVKITSKDFFNERAA